MDIQKRLDVFFRRLADAPAAGSAEEALRLVCRLIEEVEAEFCPVPRRDPPPRDFTGRMYAPKPDMTQHQADGGIFAMTRRHRIHCAPDGRITILHKIHKTIVLNKPGKR